MRPFNRQRLPSVHLIAQVEGHIVQGEVLQVKLFRRLRLRRTSLL